jgi:hypothetical protein
MEGGSRADLGPQLKRSFAPLLVVAVVLLAVEVFLRACSPVEWRAIPEPLAPTDQARTLYRASAIPGLTYELRPDLDQESHGARVVTNALGMRDRGS